MAEQPEPPAEHSEPPAEHSQPPSEHSDEPGAGPSAATEESPGPRRRPRSWLLLTLAAVVLVLDVVSKQVVVATIAPGENVRLLGGLLYVTYARNTGAAFSFAQGFTIVFTLVAVAVVVVIVRTARRLFSLGWAIALGLVLGGALGNLMDRIFRAPGFLRGGVVDFISVFAPDGRAYPIFNLADSAIVCGGVLGALLAFRGIEFDGRRGRDRPEDAEGG